MNKARFSSFPRNARLAIIFTIAGWVFLILSNAVITSTISLLQITLALVCSVVIYSLKPWARIFCAVINLFMISGIVYTLYMLFSATPDDVRYALPTGVYLMDILLFAVATFFLMNRETAAFYKEQAGSG